MDKFGKELLRYRDVEEKISEQEDVSYKVIFEYILNDASYNGEMEDLLKSLVDNAKQYVFYRRSWEDVTAEELRQYSEERRKAHAIFVMGVKKLAEYSEKIFGDKPIWIMGLRGDRKVFGDFAEYIVLFNEYISEGIERLEAIRFAQEHQNETTELLDMFYVRIQLRFFANELIYGDMKNKIRRFWT